MSKRLCFLISFVLVLGLNGTARADAIEVNNPSFEYDINGVQITEQTWFDNVQGWTVRDTTTSGWAGDWFFTETEPNWPDEGFEAADGTVAAFCPTLHGDDGIILEIYQILDDANATIAENRRYTLTFNALKTNAVGADPDVNALLFYSVGVGEVNEADPLNDVILANKRTKLTSPTWDEPEYAGWEEITLTYTALSGAGSIGERLGIKLNVPVPWYSGVFVAMDNVRLEWSWATDAWDPDPADEGEDVLITGVTLSWQPGSFAADVNGHEVYFGTDEASVEDATTATAVIYRGPNDVAGPDANGRYSYVIPGGDLPFALGGTYYWRIDEVNEVYAGPPAAAPDANGRWKGDIWSFMVEGRAKVVYPADGAEDIPTLDLSLYWEAGVGAGSHDVYFGSNKADVTDATTASDPNLFRGNQLDVNDPNYPVEDLGVGKPYFWRIDEVNTATGTFVEGHVWAFTTGSFLIVDSFEEYRYQTDQELRAVWKDYWSGSLFGKNGAEVKLMTTAGDPNMILSGEQSMEYYFRCYLAHQGSYVGSEAEADLPLEVGTDWTAGGVKALVLNFYGDPCNLTDTYGVYNDINPDQMWVALSDDTNEGLVQYPDMGDIAEASWHTWNISLLDPNFSSVDMNNVAKVYIGFGGQKIGQSKAGAGMDTWEGDTVWFDEIRLYPPRCLPTVTGIDVLHGLGDLTEDCNTDYFDLEIMASHWNKRGQWAAAAPPADPPEVWYRFDEGSGTTTTNSGDLGSTYDGVLVNGPNWTTDAHPNDGNALDFDGDDDGVYVADSPDMTGDNTVSFTAWVKREADISAYGGVIVMSRDEGEGSEGDNGTGVHTDKTGTNALGYTWNNWQESWGWESGLVLPLDKWVFVALTVEPTQGIMYLAEPNAADPNIYDLSSATNVWGHDGLSEYGDSRGGWDGTSPIYLGRDDPNKTDDATFPGKISDVRVYDYTLLRGNIMYLAGVSGIAYVPLNSVADLVVGDKDPCYPNVDEQIDFRDYSVLAAHWLEEHLWP